MVKAHEPSLAEWLFWAATIAVISLAFADLCRGATAHQSHCYIQVTQNDNGLSIGSGTLAGVSDDRKLGVVITCGHLFTDGNRQIVVRASDGNTHGGRLLEWNRNADLAAILISNPGPSPSGISANSRGATTLVGCGQGYKQIRTNYIQRLVPTEGNDSYEFSGLVREGDSGGGVLSADGSLVAVIWGASTTDNRTVASGGNIFLDFATKHLTRPGFKQTQWCPDGSCRQSPQGWQAVQPSPSYAVVQPSQRPVVTTKPTCNCKEKFSAYEKRFVAIESMQKNLVNGLSAAGKGRPGPAGPQGERGPKGEPGDSATVDIEVLAAKVIEMMPPTKPEPFYLRVDRNSPYQPVSPGQYVTLPLTENQAQHTE